MYIYIYLYMYVYICSLYTHMHAHTNIGIFASEIFPIGFNNIKKYGAKWKPHLMFYNCKIAPHEFLHFIRTLLVIEEKWIHYHVVEIFI